jgi:hypothetical protein
MESLLATFNLTSTVTFPTRIDKNSSTLIDNIYIDIKSFHYTVHPHINGLSDHDARLIELYNILNIKTNNHYKLIRRQDRYSISTFINLLSNKNWEEVFQEEDVNTNLNKFLNIFLRNFNLSFPYIKRGEHTEINPWLTTGIRTSCITKRNLYVIYRNNPDLHHQAYYRKYCNILSSVFKATKKNVFGCINYKI